MKSLRRTTLSLLVVVALGLGVAPSEAQTSRKSSVASEAFVAYEGSNCVPKHSIYGLYFTRTGTGPATCWANAAVNLPVGSKASGVACRVSAGATNPSPDKIAIRLKKRGDTSDAPIIAIDSQGSDFTSGNRWIGRLLSVSQSQVIRDDEAWFITVVFNLDGTSSDSELKVEYCQVNTF